jgi:SAM-dependent methyltransferase
MDLANLADGLHPTPSGIWYTDEEISGISYNEADSDLCFSVEDRSFWFAHRNNVIGSALTRFPPAGLILDIGGGNGFVAKGLIDRGFEAAVLEPSRVGARHARERGVPSVIRGTLKGAGFHQHSIDAAGLFDVIEHIEDAETFLQELHPLLREHAKVYVTVPAFHSLWSADDAAAGHFRRYSRRTLEKSFDATGFDILFMTYFFSLLPLPIFLARSLPSRLGLRQRQQANTLQQEHRESLATRLLKPVHHWEVMRIGSGRTIGIGASILAVAQSRTVAR